MEVPFFFSSAMVRWCGIMTCLDSTIVGVDVDVGIDLSVSFCLRACNFRV